MTVDTATEAPSRPGVAASVVDATKVYGTGATQVRALDHVTLDFATGQFTAVMGASGSGRSTLPQCLAGLDALTSGSAFVGGTDLGRLDDKRLTCCAATTSASSSRPTTWSPPSPPSRTSPCPAQLTVHLDAGYDSQPCRDELTPRDLTGRIARRGQPVPIQVGPRWIIERTHACGNHDGKLRWCTERRQVGSSSGSRSPLPSSP